MATFPVRFVSPTGEEVQAEVADDRYLLDAAADAGLDLSYFCLQGWCCSCAGRILEGQVDQSEARRFFTQDKTAGYVLLCCAFARSPLRILTQQKEPMRAHRLALGLPTPRG